MSRALVSGATGFVGGALVDRLLAEGWEVTAIARDASRLATHHQGKIAVVQGDLTRSLPLMPIVDVVFHCAADMDMFASRRAMARTTVDGTFRMIEVARQARAKRFVHVSSQAVYGFDRHYYDADERTPMRKSPWPYCETKRQAEMHVWDAARAGLEVVVVRPGFIYGPGDRRTLPPVVKALKAGQLKAHIDWGEFDAGPLHIENCAQGLYLAGTRPEAANQTYNLGDGRMLTIRQLTDDLCGRLGIAAPEKNLPYGMAMALGAAVELGWKALFLPGNPPMSPFLVAMLRRNSGFSIEKARRELGYVPRRQWEESLPETIAWCEHAERGHA